MKLVRSLQIRATLICGLFLLPLLYASVTRQASAPVSVPISAETWARNVVNFLTDPHFYDRFAANQVKRRFALLITNGNLDSSGGFTGRNTAMGILWLDANLDTANAQHRQYWIESVQCYMPLRDAQGDQLYPLLKVLLETRLRTPVWSHKADGNWLFWRKGKSKYVVSLDLGDYATNGRWPETGPFVVASAGEEQGDSEEE